MRVLLACPYAWDAPGGVQTHVRQLAYRLRDLGHRVLVVAPSSSPAPESFVRVAGAPFRVPYNQSVAPIAPTPAAFATVREAMREFHPDVVHVHEPFVPGPSMFSVLASRAPVVATFHAYADRSRLFDAAVPALRRVWNRLAARLAVSEAAAVFVASRMAEGGLRIVPNGIDVGLFQDAEPAPLPEGRRILFVNRLDPRKGFRVMVDAFAMLAAERADVLLVVAGDGAERGALRELSIEARSRVVRLGTVPHDELPPYHAASEVFCSPATGRESFGIVLVEAMAAGLPVVASDIPGYREVVRDGREGILVPPKEPDAVAEAIGRILDSPQDAERFGAAGRERAADFSWDSVAREIEQVYAEVAAS
jgi:phosphatidylinositol alpha-mannosyltransferase